MTEKTIDVHQKLMDEAYNTWQKGLSYDEFIDTLDNKHKLAVLTGNLNYQVENGGFLQWHNSLYSPKAYELLNLLSLYKNKPYINNVMEIVREALSIMQEYETYYYADDDVYLTGHDFGELDDKFYKINEQFLITMEEILKGGS